MRENVQFSSIENTGIFAAAKWHYILHQKFLQSRKQQTFS